MNATTSEWVTRSGARLAISSLTDLHIVNILRLLQKEAEELRQTGALENPDNDYSWRHFIDERFFPVEAEAIKRKLKWDLLEGRPYMDQVDLSVPERGTLERRIVGAIKDTINAHGPISERLANSAAKRVIGAIKDHNKNGKA